MPVVLNVRAIFERSTLADTHTERRDSNDTPKISLVHTASKPFKNGQIVQSCRTSAAYDGHTSSAEHGTLANSKHAEVLNFLHGARVGAIRLNSDHAEACHGWTDKLRHFSYSDQPCCGRGSFDCLRP